MASIFRDMLIWAVPLHVYLAVVVSALARKTGTPDAWMAWVPFANLVLLCKIARKPSWWVVLMMILGVNIIVNVIIWISIAEVLGKPRWLGYLMIVPGVNFIVPLYLAFSGEAPPVYAVAPPTPSAGGVTCPACGAPGAPSDTFCGACGRAMPGAAPVASGGGAGTAVFGSGGGTGGIPGGSPSGAGTLASGGTPSGGALGSGAPPGGILGTGGATTAGGTSSWIPTPGPAAGPPASGCPQCGSPIPAGKRFCARCGHRLPGTAPPAASGAASSGTRGGSPIPPAARLCPNPQCGKMVPAGKKFCAACGTRFT